MHLKQLKLAGFKSFVDPTIVPFSSQLVAVVGPNGCGKSNIIDAVRWVMGEASAKSLRGESMTDVIFNGSSNRKPVGLASVELVFDNSQGRLLGEYASYQEIAIKRVVTRDGESGYFLNGTRCRRRDITDMFLGTGAGSRGYSIIGQNTISQFVEAKPEELRAYFEEAAGVSKYKDRRRETLQRIEKTRENLSRVDDICRELASQLQRLERQATVAQRYKALKIDERHYKRDILVIKYRNLMQDQEQTRIEMSRLSCLHEDHQASASNALKLQVTIEAQLSEAQESFQSLQAEYYQVGNEVARLQEMQQQQLREKQQVQKDQHQVTADIQLAEQQIQLDNEAYCIAKQALNDLQALLETHKKTFAEATQALHFQQTSMTEWDIARQELQQKVNYFQRETQVGQLNLQHSGQRKNDAMRRLEKIQVERLGFETTEGNEALIALQEQDSIAQNDYAIANDHLQSLSEHGRALNLELRESEQQLRLSQDKLQTLTMQHAAMEAAQQAALHEVKTASSDLVSFCDHPRLLELISIEEPWRSACEWVLGESLQAVTLLELDALWPALEELEGKSLAFVTADDLSTSATSSVESAFCPRLLDKIEGFKPSWIYALDQVFTADTLEEAMRVQKTLLPHQSVITRNGFWLGVGWLRVANFAIVDETSFLLRKKELSELHVTLDKASQHVSLLRIKRDGLHDDVAKNDREQNALKRAVADYHLICVDVTARLNQKQQALQHALIRSQALQEEQDELISCLETLALEQSKLEDALKDAAQQCQEHENQLQQVTLEKTELQALTLLCRAKVDDARANVHSTELQCSREQLNVQRLSDAIQREERRLDTLNERLLALNQRYHNFDTSDIIPSDLLSKTILQHQHLEIVLTQTRHQVDELQLKLKDIHLSTLSASKLAKEVQDDLLKHQMAEQALSVRMSTLIESLTEFEADADIHVMLDELQPTMTLDLLSSQLIEIESKIKKLGAINLVAIEEYQIELARKTHLDEQSCDLKDAIAMLETAIAKMDKETQTRLKDTFERVDTLFQALFPRLFGGGQARLQLTCDNLLEAGIIVMAQPPGKRNSTIHLLSGGEKAMTAVALVFAIFQLNPSPFCMLDEVDAPLDDLNVGRFCDLVKEMSHYVQFLLISHNKVTMELAGHLIGVTMREPGVSRIVAVDVEQALSLTEPVV